MNTLTKEIQIDVIIQLVVYSAYNKINLACRQMYQLNTHRA